MNSLDAQSIPGTEGSTVSAGAWSPDGRSIVYAADGKLVRLDIASGSPQILASASTQRASAWSSAGVILFATDSAALYQILASGGEAKPVANSTAPVIAYPSFLPDGRRFLYCKEAGDLSIGDLDSKEGKRLTPGSSGVFIPPAWLLNVRGSTLVAQSFDAGKRSLYGDPIPIADRVAVLGPNGGAFSVSQAGVLAYRRAIPIPNDLTWYDRHGKRLGTVGEQGV